MKKVACRITRPLVAIVCLVSCVVWAVNAAPPAAAPGKGAAAAGVEKAREQAKLLHTVYAATLDTMHHHYFRRDRAVVPSRAMEDIFEEVERDYKVKAKWISVNTRAMSTHHEPEGTFEKEAARVLGEGKAEYEAVEDGVYRRAGAIPLAASCIACHVGLFAKETKTPRVSALVISVPLPKK
ncbi:MAG: DUF3365 domain-containing protein [Gemmataceae bacterium]